MVEKSTKSIVSNLIFSVTILITTFLLTIYYWPQNNMSKNVKVAIKQGESLDIILKNLLIKGVLTNEMMFKLLIKIKGLDTSMPIGTFNLKHININNNNKSAFGRTPTPVAESGQF